MRACVSVRGRGVRVGLGGEVFGCLYNYTYMWLLGYRMF